MTWLNVVRIDYAYRPKLSLDVAKVPPLKLHAASTPTVADLAPIVEGKPDVKTISSIDLQEIAGRFSMQRIVFEAARDVFDQVQPTWKGNREVLLAQLIRLVEAFNESDHTSIKPPLFNQDDLRRRIMMTVNMTKIVQHIFERIRFENVQGRNPYGPALRTDTAEPYKFLRV